MSKKVIGKKPYIIAGPCSIETYDQAFLIAESVKNHIDLFRAGIWKPRTSPNSFEGVGQKGLGWLRAIKKHVGLRVATEVVTAQHVDLCLKNEIDCLWIGARTTVNPYYVQEIAEALKGVNIQILIKNPIHPELNLWIGAIERIRKSGINNIAAVHRGFYSYSKNEYRNNPKWEIPIKLKKEIKDISIICDPSHISGRADLIDEISQTAMDLDFNGLMIETHNKPDTALSDGNQQITPKKLKQLINNLTLRNQNISDINYKKKLVSFRKKIDLYDKKIIELLYERKRIVQEIAKFKNTNKLTALQIDRWIEILKTRKERANNIGLDNNMIVEIFELIHKYSIFTQTNIMREE